MNNLNNLLPQDGRIIMITGANSGLGYHNSLTLARKGAKVIMACRNLSKANKAKADIEKEVPAADLEIMQVDLSSLKSVRKLAQDYQAKYNRLDVLINNAGIMMPPYSKTDEGFELQFVANYLGHFLLTGLLLPTILKTPDSRIVSLSSLAHKNGKINFDDLQSDEKYSAQDAYAQSKLACLMYAFELQRRLEKNGVHETISTAAHPGIADTELSRHFPKLLYTLLKYTLAPFISHSGEEGAKPTLLAAIGKADGRDYFGPTGFKEMKGKPGKASYSALSEDEAIAKRLWNVSEELANFKYQF